jgi:hypothetical protein
MLRLAEEHARDDQAATVLREATARMQGSASAASAPPYAKDAREIARMASFDLGGVLRGLESAQVKGIKVVRVDADAAARKVEVDAEASDADAASAFVQALNAGNAGSPWVLSRIQASGTSDMATLHATFP